jgi:formamidopyrimidine-DNA glycosylase
VPELPEVESVAVARAALLGRRLTGLTIRTPAIFEPDARAFRRAVVGRRLDRIHRHGKYLF